MDPSQGLNPNTNPLEPATEDPAQIPRRTSSRTQQPQHHSHKSSLSASGSASTSLVPNAPAPLASSPPTSSSFLSTAYHYQRYRYHHQTHQVQAPTLSATFDLPANDHRLRLHHPPNVKTWTTTRTLLSTSPNQPSLPHTSIPNAIHPEPTLPIAIPMADTPPAPLEPEIALYPLPLPSPPALPAAYKLNTGLEARKRAWLYASLLPSTSPSPQRRLLLWCRLSTEG
ncbi:hypothetical protein DFP72DRAFT_1179175 [Ephemerocybe angulata]|uniref:Uncharacterized protein n=1 Tax=Ephemerocybe angulata TaxID=980116 RepID=A0A8H6H8U3_9AGAR|nr:hypothetical protein DFP72DRAFT_1179175 [Tulosesus angulatus]